MSRQKQASPSALNPEAGWFGFSPVDPAAKAAKVRRVFDSVASRYDLMNDLMSGGLHRLWKDRLLRMMHPLPGQTILDVAGGTGDMALRCAEKTNGKARVIVCDINAAMLAEGRSKAINKGWLPEQLIEWVAGDAEALPMPTRSVDLCCIVFGLRNVTHIDAALAEFYRVLKPGGRFFCMEFSSGVRPEMKMLYDFYSFSALPWLGEKVARDAPAYQYLAESIRQFPDQPSFARRMEDVGFAKVRWRNILGGITAIHSGWRL